MLIRTVATPHPPTSLVPLPQLGKAWFGRKMIDYNKKNTKLAQNLRKNMTKEEKQLWYDYLKKYKYEFHRQRPIGNFIADFYCAKLKLVIELDGSQHFEEDAMAYDEERTEFLRREGITVIRYSNYDVNHNFEAVCEDIDKQVTALAKAKPD